MVEIVFDFRAEGEELAGEPLLKPCELDKLFAHTREQIRRDLTRKLGDVHCDEHGEAPQIRVTGIYDNGTEQLDIQYHIDACCQMFFARVVRMLNQAN